MTKHPQIISEFPVEMDPATVREIEEPSDLKSLIEKNIKWSQVIYEQNRAIKRRLTFMVLGNYLRLLMIILPLIVGFWFLPPLIKQLVGQYQGLFNDSGTNSAPSASPALLQKFFPSLGTEQLKQINGLLQK